MKGIKYLGKFISYSIDMRKVKALVLLGLCYILSLLVGCRVQCSNDRERYEAEILRLNEAHAAELEAVVAKAEAGIYVTSYLPEDAEGDAWTLARWLGCLENLYPGISAEAKTLACWVVFNRLDSSEYPDDMNWVLLQEGQFAEYNPEGEVTEQNFAIAANQISRWKNGDIRPCGEGAVFIAVSSEGVELRDEWDENARCNRWRA